MFKRKPVSRASFAGRPGTEPLIKHLLLADRQTHPKKPSNRTRSENARRARKKLAREGSQRRKENRVEAAAKKTSAFEALRKAQSRSKIRKRMPAQ